MQAHESKADGTKNVHRVTLLRSTTDESYWCISQFLRKLSHSLKSSFLFGRNYCSQSLQSLLLTSLCHSFFISFFLVIFFWDFLRWVHFHTFWIDSFSFSSKEIERYFWVEIQKFFIFKHLSVGSIEIVKCLFTIYFKFPKTFSSIFEDINESPFFDKNMHQFSSHLTFLYGFFFSSK